MTFYTGSLAGLVEGWFSGSWVLKGLLEVYCKGSLQGLLEAFYKGS